MKFGRTYSMLIQTADNFATVNGVRVNVASGTSGQASQSLSVGSNAVQVDYPLTLEFDVKRDVLGNANVGHFILKNLREDTRRLVFRDRYQTNIYRQIILRAGYESEPKLPIIFQGNITYAYSYRQKQDWITEIEAYDGGFGQQNGQVSTTIPSGYNVKDVLTSLIKTLPNVSLGVIGTVDGDQSSRGLTMNGNSWESIQALAPNANAFIDLETAYVIGINEYVPSDQTLIINADSGLLGTPRRFDLRLDVSIIFEPRLRVGQIVTLDSTERYYSGLYVVNGVEHRGVISGAVNGELVTVASLWKGTTLLQEAA